MRTHLVIPDTQVKPGVPLDHLTWIGRYIVERKPDVIVHLGDHYDFPSLSSYDKGKRSFEGRRYRADVQAGHDALEILEAPLNDYNKQRREYKEKQYKPEKHYILGNHEARADRAAENQPELSGLVGTEELTEYWQKRGWNVHRFGHVVDIDGIWYVHYVANPMTGKPLGGMIETRLKNVGNSFTMGHVQTLMYGLRYVGRKRQHGLVCGSCYLHDEDYKGPSSYESMMSGNQHWRGVIVKHQVEEGQYDPMFVSLDYLCRRYEGKRLDDFLNA